MKPFRPSSSGTDRFLVNPTLDQVLATVHELDPHISLPPPEKFSWGDSWMLRLLTGRRR